MIPSPPYDPGLPQLSTALDGEAVAARLRVAMPELASGQLALHEVEPVYVRYKPATSCLIAYRLALGAPDVDGILELPAHLRVYANDQAARIWSGRSLHRLVARAAERHPTPLAARAALLPALGGLLQVYPVDRALPHLVTAASPAEAGNLLAAVRQAGEPAAVESVELVRYRPGRKALLRYRLAPPAAGAMYAKTYSDERASRQAELGRALSAAGVAVPTTCGALPDYRLLIQAAAPGRPLLGLRGTPAFAGWLPAVADALRRLHAMPTDRLPREVPAWTPTDTVAVLRQAARTVEALMPELAGRVDAIAMRVAAEFAARTAGPRLMHGDFYDDQVLVGPAGVILLDLDEARLGEPLADVGNFLGHMSAAQESGQLEDARASFLAAENADWASEAPLHEAAALLRMAVGPFRRLEPEWPQAVARLVDLAGARLNEYRRRSWPPARQRATVRDPAIPGLPAAIDAPRMAAELGRVLGAAVDVEASAVVRHKPGRRCTLRYEVAVATNGSQRRRALYLKVFASERAPRVHATLVALAGACDSPSAPRLPEPLGCLTELRTVIQGAVHGQPVDERGLAGDPALVRRLAAALYALHTCAADLSRCHGLAHELAPLAEQVARLSVAEPAVASAARWCLAIVRARAERAPGWGWRWRPVHRDFYPDQVLLDGERVGFVDLDDAAMSEPALDVANFTAHLRLMALRQPAHEAGLRRAAAAFVAAYGELDVELDFDLVRLLEAAALLRLADIHQPRAGGSRLAARLLTESRHCLARVAH